MMALVTCPGTFYGSECGAEIDDQTDYCQKCRLAAPGGEVTKLLGADAPRFVCLSCDHAVGLPGDRLWTQRGTLNDEVKCPNCGRENPSTTRWETGHDFITNLGNLLFQRSYWLWVGAFWFAVWGCSQTADTITGTIHDFNQGQGDYSMLGQVAARAITVFAFALISLCLMLNSLPKVTQKVTPNEYVPKICRWIFANCAQWLYGLFVQALLVLIIIAVILGAIESIGSGGKPVSHDNSSVTAPIAAGFAHLMSYPMMGIGISAILYLHFLLCQWSPHIHLWVLKQRNGFIVDLAQEYLGVKRKFAAWFAA